MKSFQKFLCLILTGCLLFSLVACGSKKPAPTTPTVSTTPSDSDSPTTVPGGSESSATLSATDATSATTPEDSELPTTLPDEDAPSATLPDNSEGATVKPGEAPVATSTKATVARPTKATVARPTKSPVTTATKAPATAATKAPATTATKAPATAATKAPATTATKAPATTATKAPATAATKTPATTATKAPATAATKAPATAATKPATTATKAPATAATKAPATAATKAPATAATKAPATTATQPKQIVHIDTDGMTDLQKAVVITAESYYLRGKYAQYDMSTMASRTYDGLNSIGRRTVGFRTPEDYTSQYTGFTDCSSFVYDVYFFALGMPITDGNKNTNAYCTSSPHTILSETPKASGFNKLSTEELAAKEKVFTDTLQPGDIIVYRYGDDSGGHAMLYVGNGRILHTTGSNYSYTSGSEKTESSGTYRFDNIQDTLLKAGHKRYLFDKKIYVIMRPLNKFNGKIPAATLQRMDLMRGVRAEKLSSHSYGQTVNPGDTMTFTFKLYNRSNLNKTLTVTETLPKYTTYVSGAHSVSGNTLSWTVSVPASQIVEVSYTVKVDASAPKGEYIISQGNVSGIAVNCPSVMIANTLSANQQTAVLDALNQLKSGDLRGIDLINAVYQQACGKTVFTEQTADELWANLVKTWGSDYTMDESLPLSGMVVPNLYGGRSMVETPANLQNAIQNRARQITTKMLVPGDIILADSVMYVYTNGSLLILDTATTGSTSLLTSLLASKRFVVLRPSMAWK